MRGKNAETKLLGSRPRLPVQAAPIYRSTAGSPLVGGLGVQPSILPWPPWLPRPGPITVKAPVY
jgi:hypothetical protein